MEKLAKDFVKDLTDYGITDGAVENILIKAGVSEYAYWDELTVKQRDLCEAYTYLWCASTPVISGSVEDSDSGWSHREGGKQTSAYDKRLLRKMGLDILARYGIRLMKSTIHITPRGMRVFPRRK